jgi:diguanylate cyclase (GGDEF)-like protein
MCFLFSAQAYYTYSKTLYSRYDEKLGSLLNHITKHIDLDDLYQCVITGEKSEKYHQVQETLNNLVDEFNLFYLYSAFVRDKLMVNICSATSEAERARGEQDMELLETSDTYPEEELNKFSAAIAEDKITFFEETSEWGAAYTGCKPLISSTGVHYGLLCADISIEALHNTLHKSVLYSILLTLGTGILFASILIFWLRRNVTGPIIALEKSVIKFAEKSRDKKKDPKNLIFDAPEINTQNEVESLSSAITQMSKDMRNYVEDILEAEETAKFAQKEAANMTMLAYKDALTHVGSKIAYDNAARTLDKDVAEKLVTEFGIAMIDLNDLKKINDNYGHDKGDIAIQRLCGMICAVFKHSPVFRLGGDEFAVVLEGHDLENVEALMRQLEKDIDRNRANETLKPWERTSAAVGYARYSQGDSVESVFKQADKAMYARKTEMKAHVS